MSRWSDDKSIQFVHLYEHHRCLWDTNSGEYTNKHARKRALEVIIAEMNIPGFGVFDCKNKIRNMRSQYCQELKKVRESTKSGTSTNNIYRPTLGWFDKIDGFLRKYVQQSKRSNMAVKRNENQDEDFTETHEDTSFTQTSDHIQVFQENSERPTSNEVLSNIKNTNEIRQRSKKKRKLNRNHSNISTALDRLDSIVAATTNSNQANEFDSFGNFIAAQLKNMPFVEALQLQMKIHQIITEHRLKLYNNEFQASTSNQFSTQSIQNSESSACSNSPPNATCFDDPLTYLDV